MHDDCNPRHRRLVRAEPMVFGIRRSPKCRSHSSGQASYQTRVDLQLPPGARACRLMLGGAASSFHPGTAHVRARRVIAVIGARSRISRHACCHVCRSSPWHICNAIYFSDTERHDLGAVPRSCHLFAKPKDQACRKLSRRRTWSSCERLSVRAWSHVVAQNDGQNCGFNHRRSASMMLGR